MVTDCVVSLLVGTAGKRSLRDLIQPIKVRYTSCPGAICSSHGRGHGDESRKKKPPPRDVARLLRMPAKQMAQSVVGQQATATAGIGDSAFGPSMWDDFFVSYIPPCSQMSEEWMRERVDELTKEVHRMFEAVNGTSVSGLLILVDALQRLGIDTYFEEDINKTLSRVHTRDLDMQSSDELHIVALRFRLLRQHGQFVPTDVFNKFRDGTGNFNKCLARDPKGLLSLYNAAHMALPGEDVLDDAITFARTHLEVMKRNISSPIADQICRTLDIPLPRYLPCLETVHFIAEYEQEDGHNTTLLELARLNHDLTRFSQLNELRTICLWWKDFYKDVNLTYCRHIGVGTYFWGMGLALRDERCSRARLIIPKLSALQTVLEDTFDDYATFEDCIKLNEAIQRWDASAASILPEYLRMVYTKLLSYFKEFEDILEPGEKYRVRYVQNEFMLLPKYFLEEAKWCSEKYMPNFKEQIQVASLSAAIPFHTVETLMGAGSLATKEAFEWASSGHDMIHACAELCRFMNDISAFKKRRKNKNEMASSLESYMKEQCTTGEEAVTALSGMTEHAWRRINKGLMEIDRALLPAASIVINQARAAMVTYNAGKDVFTFAAGLEDSVTTLFLKPVSQLNNE